MDAIDATQFAIYMQTRRARRAVEKQCPDQLPFFDSLLKNGAGQLLRAVYLGGTSDGIASAAGLSLAGLSADERCDMCGKRGDCNCV